MTGRSVIFLHSSNEMYGADRVLLQVVETLLIRGRNEPIVWLPDDVTPGDDNVADHLARAGIRTFIRPLPILRRKNLRPARLPGLIARSVTLWWSLLRARPAAVYLGTSACLIGAVAARLAGVRTIVLHNQEIWQGGEGRILAALAGWCTTVVCISKPTREAMSGRAGRIAEIIPNAVDDPTSAHDHGVPDRRGDGPIELVIASRWNTWKGHGTLLAALGASVNEYGLHLTVLGAAPLAGEGVDVRAIAAGLADHTLVTILGQVDDIGARLEESDFVVVPSDDPEPFGLVAIEAFARSRPVIASADGGLGDIVTDGVNGLVFPNRDVLSLTAILDGLDRAESVRLGSAARESYVKLYSVGSFQERFAALWDRVLTR